MSGEPKPGEWVLLWGQVEDANAHPDDVVVELFSHNTQFAVDVRRDRVLSTPPPPFARQCPSLYCDQDEKNVYRRCSETAGHGSAHLHGSQMWNDLGEHGRIEDDV